MIKTFYSSTQNDKWEISHGRQSFWQSRSASFSRYPERLGESLQPESGEIFRPGAPRRVS